jgi:glycerol kinase
MGYILAIDQGTTNTKALLVDKSGGLISRGSVPTGVHYPQPGWVEQDPRDIWQCTLGAIAQCLQRAGNTPSIAALAIANQRETAMLWDRKTGEPCGPAVVWQCRRTAPFCRELKARGLDTRLQTTTGLQVDPMFSGSKIRWLIDHTPEGAARAVAGELCAGTVDTWLLWNLTAGTVHATDATNASRTQLMNLADLNWSPEILDIFGIPIAVLPTIHPSSHIFGATAPLDLLNGQRLAGGIPIASLIGDSHASLFGLGGFRAGSIKATYGTGTSVMLPTAETVFSQHGLSTTVAWVRESHDSRLTIDKIPMNRESSIVAPPPFPDSPNLHSSAIYALEGNIYSTGGAVGFIGGLLGLKDPGPEVEALARSVESSAGVTFVPALAGLGAPHWQESAQGLITGLTLGIGRGHIARATLEAIAFQVRDVFEVMQTEAGTSLQTLLADGGASRNDLLMQMQADSLACAVERSRSAEVTPLGAAFLAGLAAGIWSDESEITALIPLRDRFEPQTDEGERRDQYQAWQVAVRRTIQRQYT